MPEIPCPDAPNPPPPAAAGAADSPAPPPPPAPPVPELIPARMLNESTYCPRLAYLMWVQQEWAESLLCKSEAGQLFNIPKQYLKLD